MRIESSGLCFDPKSHSYWWGHTRIPSVTQILDELNIKKNYDAVPEFVLELAAARGTAIHQWISDILMDREVVKLPAKWAGYKKAFEAFLTDYGELLVPVYDEQLLYCDYGLGERFAGTVDLIAEWGDGHIIIDWKTGSESFSHAYQVCAYIELVKQNFPDIYLTHAAVVYLDKKGKYTMKLSEEGYLNGETKSHMTRWLSCVEMFYDKLKHGEVEGYQ